MSKIFAERRTCERCGHSLAPNDWIGVCSVTLQTGCRWCMVRQFDSITLRGGVSNSGRVIRRIRQGQRGIVRYAEDGVTEILAERE